MPFGLSFGSKKNKVKTDTATNVSESTNQAENSTRSSTGVTSNISSGTQVASGTSSTSQTARDATQVAGTTKGSQTSSSTLFGADVLSGLEGLTSGLLRSVSGGSSPSQQFDAESFIRGGVNRAAERQGLALEADLNQLADLTGGTSGGNSMAALLANQLRGDFAANIAGVESDLTAQANQIINSNIETGLAQSGQEQNFLAGLLASLRGGRSEATGVTAEATSQSSAGTSTGAQTTAQQQSQASQQTAVQTQQLVEALASLLNSNSTRSGTESVRGTEKSKGGGFSLAI